MKQLSCLGLLLVLSSCTDEPPAPSGLTIARCADATGDVRYRPRSSTAWTSMKAGTELAGGDWVQTAEGARAMVEFGSGAKLGIEPSSIVVIEEPSLRPGSGESVGRVSLKSGVVRGVVTSSAAANEVLVGTPDGAEVRVAAVIGSGDLDYRVKVRKNGETEFAVTRGRGQITSADGRVIVLGPGQAQDVKAGTVVGGVVALPDFPALIHPGIDATVTFDKDLRVDMSWNDVAGVSGYLIEIAEDQSFRKISREAITPGAGWIFEPNVPSTYFWRVASRSTDGREGEFGFARRLMVTEERVVDLLVAPQDDATVVFSGRKAVVSFSWQSVEPPAPYVLVVSRDQQLDKRMVITRRTTGQGIETRELGAGVYYWGVFAERPKREKIFKSARKITVKRNTLQLKVPREVKWK